MEGFATLVIKYFQLFYIPKGKKKLLIYVLN